MRRFLAVIFVNCLVFVGLCGLLFLALEVYLRTTDALQVEISLYSPFNYRLNPLFHGYYHGGFVSVNTLGLRGPETSRQKPPGVLRIAFFGDSYTFGDEIDVEDTFPHLVQERLRQTDGRRVEVLNFGVPGYDTVREYSYLKEDGLAFEPDVVAVVYVYNDAVSHTEREAGYVRKASLFRSMKDYLAARSYAFYYVRRGLRTFKTMRYFSSLREAEEKARPMDGQPEADHPAAPEQQSPRAGPKQDPNVLLHLDSNPGWQEVKRGIGLFQKLAEERGFKLFFVLYPFPPQEDPAAMEGFRFINRRVKEAVGPGTPVLDLLAVFERSRITWEGHPKRAPNELAAEAIVALLKEQGWLDQRAARR